MSGNGSIVYDVTNSTVDSLSLSPYTGYKGTYQPPFGTGGVILSSIIIFSFLIIGASANLLTIIVIMTYKELNRNVFMRFIISLCVSDLISALISWLFLYRRTWGFDDWEPLPNFFCSLYWAVDIMTSYVTALHILSFALLRYISIQHPLSYKKIKLLQGNIWMAIIWFLCFCAAFVPGFFIFGPEERKRYRNSPFARWPSCTAHIKMYNAYVLYQRIGYTIFFYGPTVGVVLTCTAVVILVAARSRKSTTSKRAEKRRLKERKAVIQLILIILSFLLGFVPFTAYEFWSVEEHPPQDYYRRVDYWFGMVGYFFLRFSECLNPFFYNLGFPKVYQHTKQFLSTKFFCGYIVIRLRPARRSSTDPNVATLSSEAEEFQRTKV